MHLYNNQASAGFSYFMHLLQTIFTQCRGVAVSSFEVKSVRRMSTHLWFLAGYSVSATFSSQCGEMFLNHFIPTSHLF